MTGELRAGVATVEFTPSAGVAMSGFGARTGPSTGAHDALSARAVAVSSGSAAGSIVVVADLVALTVGQVDRLRLDIARRTGLPEDAVVVTVTHTHAGPHVTPDGLGPGYDQQVAGTVERAIVSAAVDAWSSRRPARWGHGRGEERTVAHNRRDPSGPVDPDVTVVRIDTEGGDPLAVLFSYSCHPVVLGAGNVLFSADWPGYARAAVEERLSGATAVFLQGCCGQVNTGHSAHASMDLSAAAGRTFEAAELLGRRVGDVASSVAAEIATTAGDRVAVSSVQVSLAHSTAPGPEETAALIADGERELAAGVSLDRAVVLRARRAWVERAGGEGFPPPPRVTVTALAWGDLDIVTLPGEPFVGFSTDIRARTPDRDVVVLGYANGVPGYLPYPPTEYDAGGYEVEEAHFFYGQSQCFAPACGPLLVETAASLLAGLPPPGARAAERDGQG